MSWSSAALCVSGIHGQNSKYLPVHLDLKKLISRVFRSRFLQQLITMFAEITAIPLPRIRLVSHETFPQHLIECLGIETVFLAEIKILRLGRPPGGIMLRAEGSRAITLV